MDARLDSDHLEGAEIEAERIERQRQEIREETMSQRVIDADGHICEPPAVWNDYIEKRYRADAIRVERDPDGRDWISVNGAMRHNLRPAAACVPWGMDDPNKVPSWEDILPGSYNGGARAKVLEEEGIERSLLFPSLYLLAGDI